MTTISSPTVTQKLMSGINARNVRNKSKLKKNTEFIRLRPKNPRFSNMSVQSLPLTFNSLADLDFPKRFSQEVTQDETSTYIKHVFRLFNYCIFNFVCNNFV